MATEQHAFEALREIEGVLLRRVIMPDAADDTAVHPIPSCNCGALCSDYDRIRPKLDVALLQIDTLPGYGQYLGLTIRFLMQIADMRCSLTR